ncbi:MAG: efflux transporter periplasmic adaptor subunit, partial [Acidobacteria bacterium]|nr:efflux transporter periplasmic adaptor subunit [Acidobacteriota bacterium]
RADGNHRMRAVGPHHQRGSGNDQRRDFGSEAEVIGGLGGDERLVQNPSDDLEDGTAVQVAGKK